MSHKDSSHDPLSIITSRLKLWLHSARVSRRTESETLRSNQVRSGIDRFTWIRLPKGSMADGWIVPRHPYLQETVPMSSEDQKDPPIRPSSPGPLSGAFARQQVSKQQRNNYHSSSLSTMVSGSVNKTGLHPGGVEYVPFYAPPAAVTCLPQASAQLIIEMADR